MSFGDWIGLLASVVVMAAIFVWPVQAAMVVLVVAPVAYVWATVRQKRYRDHGRITGEW